MKRKGRPDKYKSEYCDLVIEHMKQGYDFESFGSVVGACKQTLYNWRSKYPEFKHACDVGLMHGYLTLQKIGMAGMTGKLKGFNATAWIFALKNRFGWRDKQDIEHSGPDGKPIENSVKIITEDYRE